MRRMVYRGAKEQTYSGVFLGLLLLLAANLIVGFLVSAHNADIKRTDPYHGATIFRPTEILMDSDCPLTTLTMRGSTELSRGDSLENIARLSATAHWTDSGRSVSGLVRSTGASGSSTSIRMPSSIAFGTAKLFGKSPYTLIPCPNASKSVFRSLKSDEGRNKAWHIRE